jgi:hypothetical protein
MAWIDEQHFEKDWWGDCTNTYSEEQKQLTYAKKMGLSPLTDYGHFPVYDLENKSVLDIGGGPTSILLKCKNIKQGTVIDPCDYPKWVDERYKAKGIMYQRVKGEDLVSIPNDEVWIYNVLQHVDSPEKIISNARYSGKIIRLFEWIDMPPVEGHPHTLTEEKLNQWLNGEGKVEILNENGCNGKAYYGIFLGL